MPTNLWPLLLAPALLAPIRYQSGPDNIILTPTRGAAEPALALPAAAPISTPLVITLSPTVASKVIFSTSPSQAISPTSPTIVSISKTVPNSPPTAPQIMPKPMAKVCSQALQAITEIALISYQTQRQTTLATIAMAATAGAEKAAQQTYPALGTLAESMANLDLTTPHRKQLKSLWESAQTACRR